MRSTTARMGFEPARQAAASDERAQPAGAACRLPRKRAPEGGGGAGAAACLSLRAAAFVCTLSVLTPTCLPPAALLRGDGV